MGRILAAVSLTCLINDIKAESISKEKFLKNFKDILTNYGMEEFILEHQLYVLEYAFEESKEKIPRSILLKVLENTQHDRLAIGLRHLIITLLKN